VTLHPAETSQQKTRYKIGFGACALIVCVLIGTQAMRNYSAQTKLSKVIDRIDVNTLRPPQVNNYLPAPEVIMSNPQLPSTPTLTSTNPISYRQFQIKPTIGLQQAPATADGIGHPGVEMVVTAEQEISYPTFEAVCDKTMYILIWTSS